MNLKSDKMKEEKKFPDFKINDTVFAYDFDINCCIKIKIRRIIKENIYPIDCIDESNNINIYKPSQLSFTQFDLVHGGFSHERPLPKIEVDQLIYVKQGDNYLWEMRHFSHFKGNECYCFKGQMTSKETKNKQLWNEYSIENPLA